MKVHRTNAGGREFAGEDAGHAVAVPDFHTLGGIFDFDDALRFVEYPFFLDDPGNGDVLDWLFPPW